MKGNQKTRPTPLEELTGQLFDPNLTENAPRVPLGPGERKLGTVVNHSVPRLSTVLERLRASVRTERGFKEGVRAIGDLLHAQLLAEAKEVPDEGETLALRFDGGWIVAGVPPQTLSPLQSS